MELKEIGNKIKLGKGQTSKSYLLEDGNVLKLFNNPKTLDEIDRFKYFLNYQIKHSSEESFLNFVYKLRDYYKQGPTYETIDSSFYMNNYVDYFLFAVTVSALAAIFV